MGLPDGAVSRAVLIGTRSYSVASGLSQLPGITGNLNGLTHLLTKRTGLPAENCRQVLDNTDDRAVCRTVRAAAREAEDLLLIYFAGHGLIGRDGRELFLGLSRTDPDDPLYSAVRFTELRDIIADSPARTKLLVLDCCYSGRAVNETMAGPAEDMAFAQIAVAGTYTLTATSANTLALAPVGEERTQFTGALLGLCAEGIPDAGPYLTVRDLFSELRRTLRPEPRQQGTDTAAELALTVNLAYRSGRMRHVTRRPRHRRTTSPSRPRPEEGRRRTTIRSSSAPAHCSAARAAS